MPLDAIVWDGDYLKLDFSDGAGEEKLGKVGDKYISGISPSNSEIGRQKYLKLDVCFQRLICTNGMTVGDSKHYNIQKELKGLFTGYKHKLPPLELSSALQNHN